MNFNSIYSRLTCDYRNLNLFLSNKNIDAATSVSKCIQTDLDKINFQQLTLEQKLKVDLVLHSLNHAGMRFSQRISLGEINQDSNNDYNMRFQQLSDMYASLNNLSKDLLSEGEHHTILCDAREFIYAADLESYKIEELENIKNLFNSINKTFDSLDSKNYSFIFTRDKHQSNENIFKIINSTVDSLKKQNTIKIKQINIPIFYNFEQVKKFFTQLSESFSEVRNNHYFIVDTILKSLNIIQFSSEQKNEIFNSLPSIISKMKAIELDFFQKKVFSNLNFYLNQYVEKTTPLASTIPSQSSSSNSAPQVVIPPPDMSKYDFSETVIKEKLKTGLQEAKRAAMQPQLNDESKRAMYRHLHPDKVDNEASKAWAKKEGYGELNNDDRTQVISLMNNYFGESENKKAKHN